MIREKEGRNSFYRAERKGLEPMVEWMTRYAIFWSDRLSVLDRLLREDDQRDNSKQDGETK